MELPQCEEIGPSQGADAQISIHPKRFKLPRLVTAASVDARVESTGGYTCWEYTAFLHTVLIGRGYTRLHNVYV